MEVITVTTKDQLKDLYDHSAMTWEGLREDSFEKALSLCGGEGAQCYLTTGKVMNELCHLTDNNAYPDDLPIFSIYPFKGLAFQYDARWMDDIIDNNATREHYHPFDETFDDYDDEEYEEDDFDTYYDDIDESLNEAKSTYPKQFAIFDHEDPDYVTIIEVKDKNEENELENYFGGWYVYGITPIQPGKKSLIANDDESLDEYLTNITDAEWVDLLKKSYQESKEENEGYDDWEESGPLYLYFDEAPQSEEEYIKSNNEFIEDSYVDKDSSSQYRWYTNDDVANWVEYKEDMGIEDEDLN